MLERLHGTGREADLIAPATLCDIQRFVSEAIRAVEIAARRCPTHAKAGADTASIGQIEITDFNRAPEILCKSLGNVRTLTRQHNSELFTADSADLR